MRLVAALAALLGSSACAHAPSPPPSPGPGSIEYALTVPASGSWVLGVEVTLTGAASDHLMLPVGDVGISGVSIVEGSPRPLPRQGDAWIAPSCRDHCTLRYQVDVLAVAQGCRRLDCMHRVGDAVVGMASVWMLHPEPLGDPFIHVTLRGGDASRFMTGLRRDPRGGYAMRGSEMGEAAYTGFGEMRRSRVEVPGGGLDVALLGEPLKMGDEAALAWVRDAASCVARLYGRFPAQATVFVLPVSGADEVVFGRVMSLSGGSVALLVGSETPASAEHGDWVVVHELSHLGTASFVNEGHWLEEGLATYYEPVLRERAGWMREEDLWSHFVSQMPRGLHRPGDPPSLEDRDDIDSTYWGGALFVFLADVRIRAATRGQRSFDDVLRASLARLGDATHAATVAQFLQVGTEATGTPALLQVETTFAVHGDTVDLDQLWASLGIVPGADGHVTLREDAPLAYVRHGIATGRQD